MAALGHSGLPRGWHGKVGDASRPGELLTGAWTAVRRWRTSIRTLSPSSCSAGTNEEGRRRSEGVRCSTGAWVPFYRVGRGHGWPE
jgi:hypothetical protein